MSLSMPFDPTRRTVLGGMAGVAGLSLATVLADPKLAKAAADGLEEVTLTTAGGQEVKAALALPDALPAPTVLLIHEWWGLNDHIKAVAAEYAANGFIALAVDLYGGQVAEDRETAQSLMQAVDGDRATDTLTSWMDWLRNHESATGKLGVVGWCFGGGWSLNASIAAPADATVVYYGRVNRSAGDLASISGPVMGHFATEDQWINGAMVGGFEQEMAEAGKEDQLTVHWYVAQHAFANPTGGRYDEEDAKLSWSRTLAFFTKHLKEI